MPHINTKDPKAPHNDCQELRKRRDELEMEFTNVVAQNIGAAVPINRQQSTGHRQAPRTGPNGMIDHPGFQGNDSSVAMIVSILLCAL